MALRRSLPQPGDIVIWRRRQSPVRFAVSEYPGPKQFQVATYDQAVERAERFARRVHVDGWYTLDGKKYLRIAQHRRRILQSTA
jgi:hypothetical protein